MYNNIGSKIKSFAKFICIIGIVISVIGGIGMFFIIYDVNDEISGIILGILAGLVYIALSSLIAWVGSWLIYAYGENNELLNKLANGNSSAGVSYAAPRGQTTGEKCAKCGYENEAGAKFCVGCGAPLR